MSLTPLTHQLQEGFAESSQPDFRLLGKPPLRGSTPKSTPLLQMMKEPKCCAETSNQSKEPSLNAWKLRTNCETHSWKPSAFDLYLTMICSCLEIKLRKIFDFRKQTKINERSRSDKLLPDSLRLGASGEIGFRHRK